MKATFIKEDVLCNLSKAEIEYLNCLSRAYNKTHHEEGKYILQIIKENNYFYKIDGIHYQVLKIK